MLCLRLGLFPLNLPLGDDFDNGIIRNRSSGVSFLRATTPKLHSKGKGATQSDDLEFPTTVDQEVTMALDFLQAFLSLSLSIYIYIYVYYSKLHILAWPKSVESTRLTLLKQVCCLILQIWTRRRRSKVRGSRQRRPSLQPASRRCSSPHGRAKLPLGNGLLQAAPPFPHHTCHLGPPVAPFWIYFFWGRLPPTKIDYREKGTLIVTSLLEDLDIHG